MATRSSDKTESFFLIGNSELAISGQQHPTGLEILKHFKARQSLIPNGAKTSKKDILHCPNQCKLCETDCECLLNKVKHPWLLAGFKVVSDISIRKHLNQLLDR